MSLNLIEQEEGVYRGKSISPGFVVSKLFVEMQKNSVECVVRVKVKDSDLQKQKLKAAFSKARDKYSQLLLDLSVSVRESEEEIFNIYMLLLGEDCHSSFFDDICREINSGWDAPSALSIVIERYLSSFNAKDDDVYSQERAREFKGIGNHILGFLLNEQEAVLTSVGFILVAKEISVGLLMRYYNKGLLGFVTKEASYNSHVGILARALDIPAIILDDLISLHQHINKKAFIDNHSLVVETCKQYGTYYQCSLIKTLNADSTKNLPFFVNEDVSLSVSLPGKVTESQLDYYGIGLYRSEFFFMGFNDFPTQSSQTDFYRNILESTSNPVVIRTLDIGSDKMLSYLPLSCDNPALGVRGIGFCLKHESVFLTQLRAMIAANLETNNLSILLPMVTSVEDVSQAVGLIHIANNTIHKQRCLDDGADTTKQLYLPPIGVMIEVPSTIFIMKNLAQYVSFFSVGSNDLIQYLLACDRNNSDVSHKDDYCYPSVIRALSEIEINAKDGGTHLRLCGDMVGSDKGMLILLILGYKDFSVNPNTITQTQSLLLDLEVLGLAKSRSTLLLLSTKKEVIRYLESLI